MCEISLSLMMRLRGTAIGLLAMIIPSLAFAAFQEPSDLIDIVQSQTSGKPMDFSLESHLNAEDVNFSIWVRGAASGKTLEDAQLILYTTLDVMAEGETIRGKMQLRFKDQKAYFLLESISGSPNLRKQLDDLGLESILKKWYALTMDPATLQSSDITNELAQDILDDYNLSLADQAQLQRQAEEITTLLMDTLLSLQHTQAKGRSLYSLKLRKDAIDALIASLPRFAEILGEEYDPGDISANDIKEARKLLSRANFHLKLELDDKTNELLSSKLYLSLPYPEEGFSFALMTSATVRSESLVVSPPKTFIDLTSELRGSSSSSSSSSSSVSSRSSRSSSSSSCDPLSRRLCGQRPSRR